MFQVRKLPSSVRYLVVFVSGMASLLSGASLVHYLYKPDLVSESMITRYYNFNFNVIYLKPFSIHYWNDVNLYCYAIVMSLYAWQEVTCLL